jgi:putative transposase
MSRAGVVWDYSAIEIFFSTLKIERVNRRGGPYKTRQGAKAEVFDYIECLYTFTTPSVDTQPSDM